MEDPRVQAFRKELNKWKKEHFFEGLVNEANSESENRRMDEAKEMYRQLLAKIHELEERGRANRQIGGDGDVSVEKILKPLGPEDKWSETLLDQVRSILMTDLIEYPLTFNSTLIDQFKKEPNFPTYQ